MAHLRDVLQTRPRNGERRRADDEVEGERSLRQPRLSDLGGRCLWRVDRRRDRRHALSAFRNRTQCAHPSSNATGQKACASSPVWAIAGRIPLSGYSRIRARSACSRDPRRPRGGRSFAPDRPRRRDDGSGQVAVETRPVRDRPARRTSARRIRPRLRDERKDDDRGDGCRDPAPGSCARAQCVGREPDVGRRFGAARLERRRARLVRGRRGGAAGGLGACAPARGLPRESLP